MATLRTAIGDQRSARRGRNSSSSNAAAIPRYSKNWNPNARIRFDGTRLEYVGLPQDRMLATVRWEAERVAELLASGLPPDISLLVTPLVAVHGATVPGGYLVAEGVGVLQAGRVRQHVASRPP